MSSRLRILFLCTGNSARSQMAEGFARYYGAGRLDAFSAGTQPTALHPLTGEVMCEVGIDVSGQFAKGLDHVPQEMDVVVTVCDRAAEACPLFPGSPEVLHWSLPDPVAVTGCLEERRAAFRGVRNDVQKRVQSLVARLLERTP